MSQFKCGVWGEPHQEVTAGHTCEGHEGEGLRGREEEVGGQGLGTQGLWSYMGGGAGHKMPSNFFNPPKHWTERSMEIKEDT